MAATVCALLPFVPDWRLGIPAATLILLFVAVWALVASRAWWERRGHWLVAIWDNYPVNDGPRMSSTCTCVPLKDARRSSPRW